MKPPKDPSNRLLELDALRGLAALGVVCFHYTVHYKEIFLTTTPPLFKFLYGSYGVQLFFMISGFVILMTLEKTKRPLDFIVSRFSRLYPCYWAAIILTFTVVSIFHLPGRETSLTDAVINMSMLQDWLRVKAVDGVYWTLTVELSFYLVMFSLFVTKKLKNVELYGLAWLVLMVGNDRILWRVLHFHWPHWIEAAGLLTYGHFFVAGILFYNLKTKGNAWYRYLGLALCLFILYLFRKDSVEPIVAAVFFLVFYLFVRGKLAWIVNRPMVFLGSISYSLYLTHQNVGYIIIKHLYSIHANALLRFMVPTICSLCIATAITYGVEKPAMAYIRSKYKIWKQKKVTHI